MFRGNSQSRRASARRQALLASSVIEVLEARQLLTQVTSSVSPMESIGGQHLGVEFDASVVQSFTLDDVKLYMLGGAQSADPIDADFLSLEFPTAGSARVFWPGLVNGTADGIVPDGDYEIILNADGITDPNGNPLVDDELDDDDDFPEADHVRRFFLKMGDLDFDRLTDISDFAILASNFNEPGFWADGNFDFQGNIDINDFSLMASRFNTDMPAFPTGPYELNAGSASWIDGVHSVTVQWTAPNVQLDGYRVYRSLDGSNFSFIPGAQFDNETFSFVDHGVGLPGGVLKDGTKYWYRVRGFTDAQGNIQATNKESVVTVLPPPTDVSVENVTASTADVSWESGSVNHTGFRIYAGIAGENPLEAQLVATATKDQRTAAVSGLNEGTDYTFYVEAVNSVYSQFSLRSFINATTRLNTPSNLALTTLSSGQIELNWQDNSDLESSFRVERRPLGGTTWQDVSPDGTESEDPLPQDANTYTDGLKFRVSGSAPNQTWVSERKLNEAGAFEYRVTVVSDTNESAASSSANGSTLGNVFQVPGPSGTTTRIKIDVERAEALHNNQLGYFVASDALGTVGGIAPGSSGYLSAALGSAAVLYTGTGGGGIDDPTAVEPDLPAGSFICFYLVVGGTTAQAIANNPNNSGVLTPKVWFGQAAANPDGQVPHLRRQNLNNGVARFSVEHSSATGTDQDFDYDDYQIAVSEVATGGAPNRPPVFVTEPVVDARVGEAYAYNSKAIDPDGQTVTYSLLPTVPSDVSVANPGIEADTTTPGQTFAPITGWSAQGKASIVDGFRPSSAPFSPGGRNYMRVHAGAAHQDLSENLVAKTRYVLSVSGFSTGGSGRVQLQSLGSTIKEMTIPSGTSFAPYRFEYFAPASGGSVGQPLTIRVVSDGGTVNIDEVSLTRDNVDARLQINSSTGQVSWTPATTDVGNVRVRIEASDSQTPTSGIDTQEYSVVVVGEEGNHPPVFVSEPQTDHRVPSTALPKVLVLNSTIHDFRADNAFVDNPDLHAPLEEPPVYTNGVFTGMVQPVLGPDRKPRVSATGHHMLRPDRFDEWFNDVPGLNLSVDYPLVLKETGVGSGSYEFDATDLGTQASNLVDFLPINGQLFGAANPALSNGGFTLEVHSSFTYIPSANQSLNAFGDDDVWVFVNNKLLTGNPGLPGQPGPYGLDRGGVHGISDFDQDPTPDSPFVPPPSVFLNDRATELGLVAGETYNFDLFFAERLFGGSQLKFTTNIAFESNEGYFYDARAIDPDSDPLSYSLDEAPVGMTINSSTGRLQWNPTASDVSPPEYPVIVRVEDGRGGFDLQEYAVSVDLRSPTNQDPVFTPDVPDLVAEPGQSFVTRLPAVDPDGDRLRYFLPKRAAGMTLDMLTGELRWTPSSLQAGQTLSLQAHVIDDRGGGDIADFDVTITGQTNVAPTLQIPSPIPTAVVGQQYEIDLDAVDANNEGVQFDLPARPTGMTIDPLMGLVIWTPTASQLGQQSVIARVRDGRGGTDWEQFSINVTTGNGRPDIDSNPPTAPLKIGNSYSYTVTATDPDGDPVTFSLTSAPAGMLITRVSDESAEITWPASAVQEGVYRIAVAADDNRHGSDIQAYTLRAYPNSANLQPIVESLRPMSSLPGAVLQYKIIAFDPEGAALTYSVAADANENNPPSGTAVTGDVISIPWSATLPGLRKFRVVATEPAGPNQLSGHLDVAINISSQGVNHPPTITSNPARSATVNQPYVYDAEATDPDGNILTWTLVDGPAGMTLDRVTGFLTWRPEEAQLGAHQVRLSVDDGRGAELTQVYTVTVRGANRRPAITSSPASQARQLTPYSYAVWASDPDGDPISYSVGISPDPGASNMPQIAANGLLTWTPPALANPAVPQNYSFTVTAWDGHFDSLGHRTEDVQTFNVSVVSSVVNRPPVISSIPRTVTTTGEPYSYDVEATDPDGSALVYALLASPSGMSINSTSGLIAWSSAVAGEHDVLIRVLDPGGAYATQGYRLRVGPNTAPHFESDPVTRAIPTAPYRYESVAVDDEGDVLTFTLDNESVQRGMTVDSNGIVSWSNPTTSGSPFNVTVFVTDSRSALVGQSYSLTIAADTEDPIVDVQTGIFPAPVNTRINVFVTATDMFGIASRSLTMIKQGTTESIPVLLDPNGFGTVEFTSADAGTTWELWPTAIDVNGNLGQRRNPATGVLEPFLLDVVDPDNPAEAPVINISAPVGGIALAEPTTVTATITAGTTMDLMDYSWSILLLPEDDDTPTELASGVVTDANGTPVDVEATIDPRALANGVYRVQVVANNGVQVVTEEVAVGIDTELKLGNFRLSFTDYALPLSGVPISITRTYDTLDSAKARDFGYGWSMNIRQAKLQTTALPSGTQVGFGSYPGFEVGTKVWVTLPGGTREMFIFNLAQNTTTTSPPTAFPVFVPGPGTKSRLTVDPAYLIQVGTQAIDPGNFYAYNPANPEYGGRYYVTTRDGLRYTIDASSGQVESVSDPAGNTLQYTNTQIVSKNPENEELGRITIQRDFLNRVELIKDPGWDAAAPADKPKHQISFTYSDGNLASVTDRAGNTVQYGYGEMFDVAGNPVTPSEVPARFLTSITDARGVKVAKAQFNASRQLEGFIDAQGNRAVVVYDGPELPDNVEQATDALSFTSATVYDAQGNPTRSIQQVALSPARYEVVVRVFNNNDMTHESRPQPADDLAEAYSLSVDVNDPSLWRIYAAEFDDVGNVVSSTDALGRISAFSYNEFGQVLTSTDPLGNTTVNDYDASGLLRSTTDQTGVVTNFTYTGVLLEEITGPLGSHTSFTHDLTGRVETTTDSLGKVVSSAYDENNRPTETSYGFTEFGKNHEVTTSTEYDEEGRVISSTTTVRDLNLAPTAPPLEETTTSTVYNYAGQPIESRDYLDQLAEMHYDVAGRLIETISPDTLQNVFDERPRSIIVYDQLGRAILTTDRFYIGQTQAIRGTRSVYDGMGRVVATQELEGINVVVEKVGPPDGDPKDDYYAVTSVSGGGIIPISAGSTVWKLDPSFPVPATARTSSTVYDGEGRVEQMVSTSGQITTHDYDDAGQQIRTTQEDVEVWAGDPYVPGTLFPGLVGSNAIVDLVTETEYDDLGRAILVTVNPAAAPSGNLINHPDLNQRTRYTHLDAARTTRTVFSDGTYIEQQSDELGRRIRQVDQLGRATEYGYDAAGHLTEVRQPQVVDPTTDELTTPITRYRFNDHGQQIEQEDAIGVSTASPTDRITKFTYDAMGRELTRQLPLGQTEMKVYDELGRMDFSLDFNGNKTVYSYDDFGRVDGMSYFKSGQMTAEQTVAYRFDAWGRRDQTAETFPTDSNLNRTTTLTFHADSQVATSTQVQGGTTIGVIHYEYFDDTGWLERSYTTQGATANINNDNRYEYDSLGRLQAVSTHVLNAQTESPPLVTTYSYDRVGNRHSVSAIDETLTVYTYDSLNRLLTIGLFSGTNPVPEPPLIQHYRYLLDPGGQRKFIMNGPPDDDFVGAEYRYDALSRLTYEAGSYSPKSYIYDLVGNRVGQRETEEFNEGSGPKVTAFEFDDNDRLVSDSSETRDFSDNGPLVFTVDTTYTYDDNGSQISKTSTRTNHLQNTVTTTATSLSWDARNRLIGVNQDGVSGDEIQYRYDDGGFRAGKTVSSNVTHYLVDVNNHTGYSQVVEEHDNSNNLNVSYIYGDDLLAQRMTNPATGGNPQPQTAVLLSDGLGSVRASFDTISDQVSEFYDYDAFGNIVGAVPTSLNDTTYRFTGERLDTETGMYDLRARSYQPNLGRFMSMDVLRGVNDQPHSLHKYSYARANPTNRIDPAGTADFSIIGLTATTGIGFLLGGIDGYLQQRDRPGDLDWDTIWSSAAIGGLIGLGSYALFAGAAAFGILRYVQEAAFMVGTIGGLAGVKQAVNDGNPPLALYRFLLTGAAAAYHLSGEMRGGYTAQSLSSRTPSAGIRIEVLPSEGPKTGTAAQLIITMPNGRTMKWYVNEAVFEGPASHRLVLKGIDIGASEANINTVGAGGFRSIAQQLSHNVLVKEVRFEFGTRTTGANPGSTPRPISYDFSLLPGRGS